MKAKTISHKFRRLTLLLTGIALIWTLASTRITYRANRRQLVEANGESERVFAQDNPGTSAGTPGAKDKKDQDNPGTSAGTPGAKDKKDDDKKKDAKSKAKKKKDEKKDEKAADKKPS